MILTGKQREILDDLFSYFQIFKKVILQDFFYKKRGKNEKQKPSKTKLFER